MINETLKQELIHGIKKVEKPYKIILFGSYAYGEPDENSDIDLVVVVDKDGFNKTYKDMLKSREVISISLLDIRKKIPIDILVYTKDEWQKLLEYDSSFMREIKNKGIELL